MRLPSVPRIHFIECGANTGAEWASVALPAVQYARGTQACSEYTGALRSTLQDLCGIDRKRACTILADGADGSSMTRTSAIERTLDDVKATQGQNGETLRPEISYPLRLAAPGVQGVSWLTSGPASG